MSNTIHRALMLCGLSLALIAPAHAGARQVAHEDIGTLTPQARGQLTRQFVLKWGDYVERVYDTPVDVWAKRMVSTFVAADPGNFRNALKRDTFEGAVAALTGTGHRLSDGAVIERLARASLASARKGKAAAPITTLALGSLTGDLVFTPVTPCRIVDTRLAGGMIANNSSRAFIGVAVAGGSFTSQGGSGTSCGVDAVGASAIAINVTAVTPAAAGYATVYRFPDTQPLAASVNYTAGSIVNNTVIVGIPNPLSSSDFRIYTFAASHYVVDIVGYYSPPQATALQCTTAEQTTLNLAPGGRSFGTAVCPAGYTPTGGGVGFSNNPVGVDMNASFRNGNGWSSLATNGSTATLNAFHYAECCRTT